MLAALIPLIGPLLSGATLSTAIGGVTITQWVTLGSAILSAAPGEVEMIQQLSPTLAPFLSKLVSDVKNSNSPHAASASAAVWFAKNGNVAIQRVDEQAAIH